MNPPSLPEEQFGQGLIEAGYAAAGSTPILLVNEPILVSRGENSQVRYNFYYPRWAYDQYRTQLGQTAQKNSWGYADLWELIPEDQFTNSAIHLSPQGTGTLAKTIAEMLQGSLSCK
jgi:hypothetical protein